MTATFDPAAATPPFVVSYELASDLDCVTDSPLVVVGALLAELDAWCSLHGVSLDDAREIARSARFNDSAGVEL